MKECSLTQNEVAEKVGKSRASVTNMLRLLRLAPEVQSALQKGTISAGHARPLLSLNANDQQVIVLSKIEREGLSVRVVEELVRELLNKGVLEENIRKKSPPASETPSPIDPELLAIRDRLRTTFGTQVAIKPSSTRKGGTLVLEYYSDDDLERLIELMLD